MDKPPMEDFNKCNDILAKAKKVNADVYAPEYYQAAETNYKYAFIELKRQNEKIFFKRNFSKSRELITLAILKAELARNSTGANKDTQKARFLKETELLRKKLDSYHDFFVKLPLRIQTRKDYEFGKLSVEESLNAFEKGDFIKANQKLNEGKSRISYADAEVNAHLKEYFAKFSKWQQWVKSTIATSANTKSYALVIDKIKHKGFLYYNGKLSKEYDVEFGSNWMGDKLYAGDNATPEGRYLISRKKSARDSGYYKAMMLNYPNAEDRANYVARRKSGQIPKSRGIGGLIEIHGNGGKGVDWTKGCVALSDDKIDELYSKLSVGSPVTIVGSTVSLSDLLN
ncbi:MAG: L,D-transpeptidase [Bacteroidetes bacterium]|nr:L,D-transpeptidase [Bacteroidota bacterium]MCL6101677.1 L,D-transpeptidase [Bacteroidota bacterium]